MSQGNLLPSSISSHGGNIIATAKELGCAAADLIDMSSNLAPFGMAPGLKEELIERLEEISYLPETGSETLRDIFAGRYGLREKQVLVGNGTTEFIYAVPAGLDLARGVIVNPTYSDYQLACEWSGLTSVSFDLKPGDGFQLDLNRLAAMLQGGELVFICNPNNPTGGLIPSAALYDFIKQQKNSIFLVDESYLPFVREPSLLDFALPKNLFVLSSFSKIYGIPGLRLGFLASAEHNMAKMSERRKPWGVNRMAQIAGEFLLSHADDYVEEVIGFVEQQRPLFAKALDKLPGVQVVPGVANFILCYLSGDIRADYLRQRLREYRIMIRNCSNFAGLDDHYFRLSLKDEKSNAFCLQMLKDIMRGKP